MKPGTLSFDDITPVASQGLGGLVRDHFGNGRLYATVSAHGGLTDISYWGKQHMGAIHFFHADAESPWAKLFRPYAGIGAERYHLTLNDTHLYPFGFSSRTEVGGVGLDHQLLLLPDALVRRFRVTRNSRRLPIRIETLHQEACTATTRGNRQWSDFKFIPKLNALVASCTDLNPNIYREAKTGGSLAQRGSPLVVKDSPKATTWIGIGCDSPITYHRGYHARSKHYLAGSNIKGDAAALFLVFAHSRKALELRLAELSKKVHSECDALLSGYEQRLRSHPQIETGSKILNSAFSQYPECIHQMKIPDRPGAIKATLAGYWVWGWDALNAPFSCALSNESDYTAKTLRFFQQTLHKKIGIPHSFTGSFQPVLKGPFPAQAQFIAALYHYVSITGDLALARELMPTCQFIVDHCRKQLVKNTGLVEGAALWPDFPEAMEETGNDVSSMNNSLLYQGLRAMEYLACAVAGQSSDPSRRAGACAMPDTGASQATALQRNIAKECREWAAKLRASFVKYLYDQEKGFFISSCDSKTLKPRKHYCAQSIFWLTPFARELVSHAPGRIADFMNHELRSDKCLLTLPHWDTAWMADGNQLGSTFPVADHFYLNAQKLMANSAGLKQWLGDVEWFWSKHTAPEAFTPEAENEAEIGVDNPGCKQLQACATWYVGLYAGLAGLDFDHEGLTLTPWGDRPLTIKGLRLHDVSVDLEIKGSGSHIGLLKLDGKALPAGARKIQWSQFKGKSARLVLTRSGKAPGCPVIVRADGLRVDVIQSGKGMLKACVDGAISGEIIVQAPASAKLTCEKISIKAPYDSSTGTFAIAFVPGKPIHLEIQE